MRDVEQWVRAEFAAARQPGVVDIAEVVGHPAKALVACTLSVREGDAAEPVRRVGLVDLETGRAEPLALGDASSASARWSPDGRILAVTVADGEAPPTTRLLAVPDDNPWSASVVAALPAVGGAVEEAVWAPDGDRLALVVAGFGAEVSGVHGSGTVVGPGDAESWRPVVSPTPEAGRRRLLVWRWREGALDSLAADLNIWETCWLGPDALLALASEGSGEGAWYAARLHRVGLDGRVDEVHRSTVQLAQPRADATGARWSVIESRASDRGLVSGTLVVADSSGRTRSLDTAAVDVSAQEWVDAGRIAFVGIRGLDTVFGVVDVATGEVEELLATDGSSGPHQPEAGGRAAGSRLVTVLERHDQPPTLTRLTDDGPEAVLSTAGPGTARLVARSGATTRCSWTSTDGQEISGLLTTPDGEGPFPLVVNVHGGPVAAWRDGWMGKDPYAAILVARGFAVLRPNIRGSVGRGQAFIDAIVGDMGGRDVGDVTTGVAALIARGVTEAGRVGITGNSYGGYLAAWAPCVSDVFSASVARSPATDWTLMHLTGNLAEFDALFVGGDPFDPQSRYATTSPLTHHARIRTPMLLTAGARDLATPASQAQVLHRALVRTGVPTELVIYPEEGHGVRSADALADQLARMIQWFETYLNGRA